MILEDGTIVEDLKAMQVVSTVTQMSSQINGIYMAKIDGVLYVDNIKNSTNNSDIKQVEYNCTIVMGPLTGRRVYNVRDTAPLGGKYNTAEIIRSADTQSNINDSPEKRGIKKTNGSMVYLMFIDGQPSNPVIIGEAKSPTSSAAATTEDGERAFFEFNGIQFNINKEGGLTISNTGGPKDAEGISSNSSAAGSSISIGTDGTMAMSRGDQKVELDKDGQIAMTGPGGTEVNLKTGGATEMKGSTTDIDSTQAVNIKSAMTKIGNSGIPSARVGDICVGTGNQGAPVISKISNGSYITMVGS